MLTSVQSPESDLLLLHRYTETGDADIFAEIVRRYTGVVYAAAFRVLRNEARAKDVTQETFFRLLRQPNFVTLSLGGWLHRSATHLAIDAKRSERSRQRRETNYSRRRGETLHAPESNWEEISPLVDEALDQLPEQTRTLLIRHFLQGTPQGQLAIEANASAATISRRIQAGVGELQQLLRKKGITVGILTLFDFCAHQTIKTAPARLLSELGKMRMVGPCSVGPVPSPNPSIIWPRVYNTPPAAVSTALQKALSCIGGGALLTLLTMLVMAVPSPQVPLTPQSEPQTVQVEREIRQSGKILQDLHHN